MKNRKMVTAMAAAVMAGCGVLLVLGIGKSNVWTGLAIVALGLALAARAVGEP